MSVSQWLLPLTLMGLISCQVGVGTPPPEASSTPTPSPTATARSPKEAALIEKYTEKGVSPFVLTLTLKSKYNLQLTKGENTPLSIVSASHPEDASVLKNYLEPLPLSLINTVTESVQQPFLSLVFSEATELESVMAQLKLFPFVQSVTLLYDQDSIGDFPSRLGGKIFDNTGKPIVNATITLRSLQVIPAINADSLFESAKQTDENGEYSMPYPTGQQEWWVIASKPGYLTVEQKINHDKSHQNTLLNFGISQGDSATALKPTANSSKEEALIQKYAQQRVSPYLLNIILQSEYDLQLKKDDGKPLSVTSGSHPDEAVAFKRYLDLLPLTRIATVTESVNQPFVSFVFSKVTDLDTIMDQLNAFPFVQSVQFNYDVSLGQPYHLQGQVFDDTGKPVANASITIRSLAVDSPLNPDDFFTYSFKADKNGKYRMGFPEGIKEVSVSAGKRGYLTVKEKVTLDNRDTFFDFGGVQGNSTTALKPAS